MAASSGPLPRQDGLYLACAQDGKALIIGRGSVRAVKLSDGSPAWNDASVPLPSGGMPSGTGFYHAGRYYLPLTTAEVAAIDLATGEIDRSASPRGSVPGNLVCYKGAVVSQRADVLERFEQVSVQRERVARKLAENPDDAIALVEQAEILLDGDKLSEAIDLLKKALALDPQGRSRELLVDSLLEALRRDFATNRKWLPELEPLVRSPREEAAYHRVLAQGLHSVGETLPALEAYLKIVDATGGCAALDRLEQVHSVRQDRWLQARLPALRAQASAGGSPEDRCRQSRSRFDKAKDSEASLRRFVAVLRWLSRWPIMPGCCWRASSRSRSQRTCWSGRCCCGWWSNRPSRRGPARPWPAWPPWSWTPNGRKRRCATTSGSPASSRARSAWTARPASRSSSKLAADSPVRAQLERTQVWPVGMVDVKPLGSVSTQNRNALFDLVGSEPLTDLRLELVQQTSTLLATDGLGRKLWELPLQENAAARHLQLLPATRAASPRARQLSGRGLAEPGLRHRRPGRRQGEPAAAVEAEPGRNAPRPHANAENQENQIFLRGVVFAGG